MKFNDLFSKIGGEKEPRVEQNERESKMNNININFTPEELNFTSLCVKALGMILKDKPDAFSEAGISGIMFKILMKDIDIVALFQKFDSAMQESILEIMRNRKY